MNSTTAKSALMNNKIGYLNSIIIIEHSDTNNKALIKSLIKE